MKVGRAETDDHQQDPDDVDAGPDGGGVRPVQVDEDGRHQQEQDVGHRVPELGDVGGVGVVGLAPVHRRAPSHQVAGKPPHIYFTCVGFSLSNGSFFFKNCKID